MPATPHVPRLELLHAAPARRTRPSALLFVHGTSHAAWCWAEQALPFFAARGYAACALSLRGHGGSEGAGRLRWSSVHDYAADVARAVARLDAPVVVVGHSLGGQVVRRFLERHTVAGAVLVAPAPVGGMLGPGLPLLFRHPVPMLRMLLGGDALALYGDVARCRALLFSPEMPDADVARHVARMGPESHRALLEMLVAPPRARLSPVPMLVMGGSADVVVPPRYVERTAHALGAECVIVPGAPHDVMLDARWPAAGEAILRWLAAHEL